MAFTLLWQRQRLLSYAPIGPLIVLIFLNTLKKIYKKYFTYNINIKKKIIPTTLMASGRQFRVTSAQLGSTRVFLHRLLYGRRQLIAQHAIELNFTATVEYAVIFKI